MIVTLLKHDRIFSLLLPTKVKGQYAVCDTDSNGAHRKLVDIEGIDGKWVVKSNRTAAILDANRAKVRQMVIEPLCFYQLIVNSDSNIYHIHTEPITDDRRTFSKYVVKPGTVLNIGRTNDNAIVYENSFVSAHHAQLTFVQNGVWTLQDLNSSNGTFVNGCRVKNEVQLTPGDIICILGFKIMIGNTFIALNSPDGRIMCNAGKMFKYVAQSPNENLPDRVSDVEKTEFFFRSPRFRRDVVSKTLKIDSPPQPEKIDKAPWILMLGPAMTMGMSSMTMGTFAVINASKSGSGIVGALPTVIMSASMLLSMLLWPILSKNYDKKRQAFSEEKRVNEYRQYLGVIRSKIADEIREQTEIINENNHDTALCVDRAMHHRRNLWERVIGQKDFLSIRLGIGSVPLVMDLKFPDERFSVDNDIMVDEMARLAEEKRIVQNVPVCVSLLENYICGIISDGVSTDNFIKNLILKITTLHSYDEVKLVFMLSESEYESMRFVKWLPHVWDDEQSKRFIVVNANDAKDVSAYLERVFNARCEEKNSLNSGDYSSHYVIIATNKDIADKCEIVKNTLEKDTCVGFSFIAAYGDMRLLPKECSMVINLTHNGAQLYDRNDMSGKTIDFIPDVNVPIDPETVSIQLANTSLDLSEQRYSLPSMVTFLEMYNVGRIEYLNPLMRWKENNPTISLQAPIGVDVNGDLFNLDLHEKFQGPHGLVAGMTGSGKSEFIITYILSMALNYHPNEVSFILIDYKGGGLAGAFEDAEKGIKLPHLAGTITNLDGAAVNRSLISIQSELRRRQAIFNGARKVSNEGTIDIYKYQKLYRDGVVSEPIPHLFIISDEFAELKTQQPEFMAQLISAARIGRSLGVHLILATQKPSGVVDDQIWSNSRFRICLKVQEKQDSNDMIKRPDAAALSATGRFYLQVGYNEFFAMGQSAWCGAEYEPADRVERKVDNSVSVLDRTGNTIKEVRPLRRAKAQQNEKQIVTLVKYLSSLAEEEGISVRKLWLDPIPSVVYCSELRKKYSYKNTDKHSLDVLLGEVDDPFNQRQYPLILSLTNDGNTVVFGAAGNGKATFITSMICEMLNEHDADTLNLYCLDFGAETLKMFEDAPQVGSVMLSSDSERIVNLFKMLRREITVRKKKFADFGGEFQAYCASADEPVPAIVVVINNYAAFEENYEVLSEDVTILSREGVKFGIYFVLTAASVNAVRYKLLQNFGKVLALRLNDKNDYAMLLGSTKGVYPTECKGRGILKLDNVYEFQTAYICDSNNLQNYISGLCKHCANRKPGLFAPDVPVLPKLVNVDFVEKYLGNISKLPIGVNTNNLNVEYCDLSAGMITTVLTRDTESTSMFMQGVCEAAAYDKDCEVVAIDAAGMFTEEPAEDIGYRYVAEGFDGAIVDMFTEMVNRNNSFKRDPSIVFQKRLYVINSLSKLMNDLSSDGKEKLNLLLEKGEARYGMHFVMSNMTAEFTVITTYPWYRKHCAAGDGIYVGEGVSEQFYLKIGRPGRDLYKELGDNGGVQITKSKYKIIKLLTTHLQTGESEE